MEIRIENTKTPGTKVTENLGFGKHFTDHMFMMDYNVEKGWYDARIVPFGNLSLHPAATVFHYGAEIFDGQPSSCAVRCVTNASMRSRHSPQHRLSSFTSFGMTSKNRNLSGCRIRCREHAMRVPRSKGIRVCRRLRCIRKCLLLPPAGVFPPAERHERPPGLRAPDPRSCFAAALNYR